MDFCKWIVMENRQLTVCKLLLKRDLEIFTSVGNPGNFYKCRKSYKILQVSKILEIFTSVGNLGNFKSVQNEKVCYKGHIPLTHTPDPALPAGLACVCSGGTPRI